MCSCLCSSPSLARACLAAQAGGLIYGVDAEARNDAQRLEHDPLLFPNLQYHFAPVYSIYHGRDIELQQGYQLQVDQLRPHSVGELTLRSRDPAAAPAAQFNYLSDDRDVNQLVEGYARSHIIRCWCAAAAAVLRQL